MLYRQAYLWVCDGAEHLAHEFRLGSSEHKSGSATLTISNTFWRRSRMIASWTMRSRAKRSSFSGFLFWHERYFPQQRRIVRP